MTTSPPTLDPVMTIAVRVGPPQELGPTPRGTRRIIPITGGEFHGPALSGEVLPGGADWQLIRPDGVAEIEARYTLRTADGALVQVTNSGFRHGPPEVLARLAQGETVDPGRYYFRTVPVFETSDPGHDWINRTVFVGRGARRPDTVVIEVFAVR